MTFRFNAICTTLALAGLATSAAAAGFPASGEQPFADDATGHSTLTRAQVQTAALASPPASGEQLLVENETGRSTLTRAQVQAAALASPPATGELSATAAALAQSPRNSATESADAY